MKKMNVLIWKLSMRFLMKRGYDYTTAQIALGMIMFDSMMSSSVPLFKRFRWYSKGYIALFAEIGKKNKELYIVPDLLYVKAHPINGMFSNLIDDKLTIRYILDPFKAYLPDYYFHINEGHVNILADLPNNIDSNISGVIKLLKEKKILAIKKVQGVNGKGFIRAEYKDEQFFINQKLVTEEEFRKKSIKLENYIVCEFIQSEKFLYTLNPYATNSLRVVVLNTDGEITIEGAFLRLGTKESGVVDDILVDGVVTYVDINSGKLLEPSIRFYKQKRTETYVHPDNKNKISGQLEHWEMIEKLVQDIGLYVPQLKYIGYDFAITNDGIKILEINSLQGMVNFHSLFNIKPSQKYQNFFDRLIGQ